MTGRKFRQSRIRRLNGVAAGVGPKALAAALQVQHQGEDKNEADASGCREHELSNRFL